MRTSNVSTTVVIVNHTNIKEMMIQINFTYSEMTSIGDKPALIGDSITLSSTIDEVIDLPNHIKDFLKNGQTLESIDYITQVKGFNEDIRESKLLDVLITAMVINHYNEKYLHSWVVQLASLNNAVVQYVIKDMIGPDNDIWTLAYIHDIKIIN